MSTLHRLHVACSDPRGAGEALRVLRDAGARDLEVRGSIPLPAELDPEPAGERARSKVLPAAVGGALVGGFGAWLLASQSALAYPLVTGGMPLIAPPPVAIVTYEGTALGLILATVAAVILEGRLWRRPGPAGPLDGMLPEGWVVIGATLPAEAAEAARGRVEALGSDRAVRTAVVESAA